MTDGFTFLLHSPLKGVSLVLRGLTYPYTIIEALPIINRSDFEMAKIEGIFRRGKYAFK